MADVRPFAGLRYDLARLGGADAMAQLVAPPYDVIGPEQRAALVAANPYNIVRLELPEGEFRYNRAARLLQKWMENGVLALDARPAYYIYNEEFDGPEGAKLTRRAIFAAVRLYDWADNVIMPHESTMTGPKADRLALLQATRVNLSPIFSVYDDADSLISQAVNRGLAANTGDASSAGKRVQPGFSFMDADGNRCRLAPVDGPDDVATIAAAFASKRLYIADGHHRYETALNFRNEQRDRAGSEGAEYVLMALTATDDPGLQVLPTHRVVTELPAEARATLAARLAAHFVVTHYPQGDNPAATVSRLMAQHRDEKHFFGAYGLQPGSVSLLGLNDPNAMGDSPDHSAAWRELDVAILQKLVLEDAIGMTEQTLAAGQGIAYVKDKAEAVAMVDEGTAQVAFFLLPTPVAQMLAIADAHDRMPRKSTYFFPKLPTGVVMRSLY